LPAAAAPSRGPARTATSCRGECARRGMPSRPAPRRCREMSPNRLLVTITDTGRDPSQEHRHRVDVLVRRGDAGIRAATSLNTRCHSAWPCCIALLLSAMHTWSGRSPSRTRTRADDAVHALVGVDLFLDRDSRPCRP
jgi:hypothetical protein